MYSENSLEVLILCVVFIEKKLSGNSLSNVLESIGLCSKTVRLPLIKASTSLHDRLQRVIEAFIASH